jgi:hypothetical protein
MKSVVRASIVRTLIRINLERTLKRPISGHTLCTSDVIICNLFVHFIVLRSRWPAQVRTSQELRFREPVSETTSAPSPPTPKSPRSSTLQNVRDMFSFAKRELKIGLPEKTKQQKQTT